MAGTCDLLVAYAPQASMGTSLEMWAAYQVGAPIFTISKMTHNWVIQSFSTRILPTLDEFLAHVEAGGLDQFLDEAEASG